MNKVLAKSLLMSKSDGNLLFSAASLPIDLFLNIVIGFISEDNVF